MKIGKQGITKSAKWLWFYLTEEDKIEPLKTRNLNLIVNCHKLKPIKFYNHLERVNNM